MSEYQIKLEAAKEYEKAIEFKRQYEELLEAFSGLAREFMDYCQSEGMAIHHREKYLRILSRSIALLNSRASPEAGQPDRITGEGDSIGDSPWSEASPGSRRGTCSWLNRRPRSRNRRPDAVLSRTLGQSLPEALPRASKIGLETSSKCLQRRIFGCK